MEDTQKVDWSIIYIEDKDVDLDLDLQLRELLQICFPEEKKFLKRRYNNEVPRHRFYIMEDGRLIAHIAVHEKAILIGSSKHPVAGIAEVMVRPEFRGRSLVRLLLAHIDEFLISRNIMIEMLFGKSYLYQSSGYATLNNHIRYFNDKDQKWHSGPLSFAMGKTLNGSSFPEGEICIENGLF